MSTSDGELVAKPEWLSYMRKYSKCRRINGFPGEFAAQAVAEVDRLTAEVAEAQDHNAVMATEMVDAKSGKAHTELDTALKVAREENVELDKDLDLQVTERAELNDELKLAREDGDRMREALYKLLAWVQEGGDQFSRTGWATRKRDALTAAHAALASQPTAEGGAGT